MHALLDPIFGFDGHPKQFDLEAETIRSRDVLQGNVLDTLNIDRREVDLTPKGQ